MTGIRITSETWGELSIASHLKGALPDVLSIDEAELASAHAERLTEILNKPFSLDTEAT